MSIRLLKGKEWEAGKTLHRVPHPKTISRTHTSDPPAIIGDSALIDTLSPNSDQSILLPLSLLSPNSNLRSSVVIGEVLCLPTLLKWLTDGGTSSFAYARCTPTRPAAVYNHTLYQDAPIIMRVTTIMCLALRSWLCYRNKDPGSTRVFKHI
uniref:uncharacterized protein LOC122604431 n=1 Tax=Erigeron canadensis TaxID=72917 RepID=UPI001CB96954|nr:uncharacterized protein LOC122604431 [Erigeron canadensis]